MAITFVISSLPNESFPANVPRKKGKQKKRVHAKKEDGKSARKKMSRKINLRLQPVLIFSAKNVGH